MIFGSEGNLWSLSDAWLCVCVCVCVKMVPLDSSRVECASRRCHRPLLWHLLMAVFALAIALFWLVSEMDEGMAGETYEGLEGDSVFLSVNVW